MLIQLKPQHLTILELELELDFPYGRRPFIHVVDLWSVLQRKYLPTLLSSTRSCRVLIVIHTGF